MKRMTVLPPELQANEYIREAAELCERGAYSEEELARYDGYWDAVRLEKTAMKSEREEEREEKEIEIALNMLADGVSIENVCKYTGLSKQQIEKLIQK